MEFYMLWLSKVFRQSNCIFKFLENFNLKTLFSLSNSEISELELPEDIKSRLTSSKLKDEAKNDYDFCLKNDIKLLTFTSKDYPINLTHIPYPPTILYYKGNILPEDECSISIIGSRKSTKYGELVAQKFVSELSAGKVTIVSGMARGIDSFAHSYSISSGGRTLAVLGSGVDIIYPSENQKLYSEIIESGAVLSQFPLHTQPIPENFPIRNHIVAGLSLGTLVIEANQKSGTMITARLAGEYGRNIYAVPGSIFNNNSNGTNSLIKDGAKIVTSSQDILQDIFCELNQIIPHPKQLSLFSPVGLSDNEMKIYKLLSSEPVCIDILIEESNLPPQEVIQLLTLLRLSNCISELPGQQYVINPKLI